MVKRLIISRSRSLLSAAMVVAFAGLGSRALGVLRERLLSARFGAGPEIDAYAVAFRIPDTLFGLFVVGAIATAFIPVFADRLFIKGQDPDAPLPKLNERPEALKVALSIFNWLIVILGGLAVLAFLLAPELVSLIAPGFNKARSDLTVAFLMVMLFQPILLGASAVFGAILQTYRHFVAFALAPVFYNLGIILGIVALVPLLGSMGLAYGVVLGALMHLIVQLLAIKATGFKWQPIWQRGPAEWQILKLMIPRSLGIAGEQISLIALAAVASTLAVGTNAIFYYAENIRALPIGVVGVAFSVAAFPLLSARAALANTADFAKSLAMAIRQVVFFTLPLAVMIYLLRAHLVRIVIGTDKFTWDDTTLAIAMVGAFAFSIILQALMPLLAKAFYAVKNTVLPVLATLVGASVTVMTALFFVREFSAHAPWTFWVAQILRVPQIPRLEALALPLAFGVGALIQLLILAVVLIRRLKGQLPFGTILQSILKTITATAALILALYFTRNVFAPLATDPDLHTTLGLALQAGFAALAGAVAFLLVSWGLESRELQELKKIFPWRNKQSGV